MTISNYGRLAQLVASNTQCPDGHGTLADCGCHGEIRRMMRSFYDEVEDGGMLKCLAAMCEPNDIARQEAFDNICREASDKALSWLVTRADAFRAENRTKTVDLVELGTNERGTVYGDLGGDGGLWLCKPGETTLTRLKPTHCATCTCEAETD